MYRGRFIPEAQSADLSAAPAAAALNRPSPSPIGRSNTEAGNPASRRIACILVADFSIAAIVRANPELRDQPLALTRMPSPRRSAPGRGRSSENVVQYHPHSELCAVAPAAKAAGVRAGMTVAQARALIPQLCVTHPSSAAERTAADALADAAGSISPVVEAGAAGCVWLDLTMLYRPAICAQRPVLGINDTPEPSAEEELEQALAEEIALRVKRIGLTAAIGIAAHKEIARLAARCGGLRIIPVGQEREFLDWMPLELVDLGDRLDGGLGDGSGADDLELRLKRLGLRRLGDLARLDLRAVGSRLGAAGVTLARLARGEGSATVNARPRAESFVEAVELDYGIDNLEPLGFVLRGMLERITARLQMRGLTAGDLILSLGLTDRRRDDRRVAVATATGEVRSLLALLELSLAAAAPAAPVETIRLMVAPRRPRQAQHDLFMLPAPAPDRLEAAVARIAALCGPDRVGTLIPADSYRPEAVRLGVFAPLLSTSPPPRAQIGNAETARVAQMALRTMRPADEIEVMIASRGVPEFVRGKTLCARVISLAGPWRRQGEWWAPADHVGSAARSAAGWTAQAPAAYARDYYELALADGGVYRAYREIHSDRWFVDGVYD
jgi:protein ImuB